MARSEHTLFLVAEKMLKGIGTGVFFAFGSDINFSSTVSTDNRTKKVSRLPIFSPLLYDLLDLLYNRNNIDVDLC